MGQRRLQQHANRIAVRALPAALPCLLGSGEGFDAWYGVEPRLPRVRELPMS